MDTCEESGVKRDATGGLDAGAARRGTRDEGREGENRVVATAEQSDDGTDVLKVAAAVNPGVMRLLVFGGGYTGRRFAAALRRRGVEVTLTSRHPPEGEAGWLRFDAEAGAVPTASELDGFSHVLVTVPPNSDGQDPVLAQLGDLLGRLPLQWLGYLSTTGVYGDSGGAWVDESSPTNAGLGRSQARLLAEQAWRDTGLPLQVLRLPAIYGPGRSPFAALRDGKARLIHKPGQVFSRIHVDDIVGALLYCLGLPAERRPGTLILADACPCPSSETLGYAAHLLGCKLPEVMDYGRIAPTMGAMASSFWSENRRASSRLLREGLGYRLLYPSYREGYRACLGEESAGGNSC